MCLIPEIALLLLKYTARIRYFFQKTKVLPIFFKSYRNFHFICAGHRVAWIIPLLGGVRGGSLDREISVNPVRKCGRGFKPIPRCIYSNSAISDGDSFLTR